MSLHEPNSAEFPTEVPPHIAAKGKMPSRDELPAGEVANQLLTDETATGYANHHDLEPVNVDLQKEFIETSEVPFPEGAKVRFVENTDHDSETVSTVNGIVNKEGTDEPTFNTLEGVEGLFLPHTLTSAE